jgi:hypothetical protein
MSLRSYIGGMPRVGTRTNVSSRIVFKASGLQTAMLPGGKILSGACSRDPGNTDVTLMRCGLIIGKIDTVVNSLGTVGHYAPSVLGVTTNAEAAGSTSVEAAAAVVTELVRRCGSTGTFYLTGPPSAAGVVTKELVTYSAASSTTITVTALTNAFVAGSLIMPTDGSENPISFLADDWGIYTTDPLTDASQDQPIPWLPTAGTIYSAQLLPWPADASLKTWVMGELNTKGYGSFVFDHVY